LAAGTVNQVQRMLNAGLAKGQAARQLGLDWRTVRRVEEQGRSTWGLQVNGSFVRCPGCGGLVEMPCRLCQVRALVRRRQLSA